MRIQVKLSDEMVKKIDKYASEIGMSRSALCSYFIGQAMLGVEKAQNIVSEGLNESINKLSDNIVKENM